MQLPKVANVTDVGCRDGFQMEKEFIPTEEKINIVNRLSKLGFKRIQITSFVNPKAVPQMKDAAEVVSKINREPGVTYSALTPNLKGANNAIDANVDELDVFMSVSESHNKANVRMQVSDSVNAISDIIALAKEHNKPVWVNLATSFGCPFEGEVSSKNVLNLADKFVSLGASGVVLADTTGMANPVQVYELVSECMKNVSADKICLHFHNTRNMGMANILAGLQAGVNNFEAALGGLGGCPFAPGASGNVSTEDVVHMLEEMGIDTGIDINGLLETARYLEKIIGRPLPGQVMKAGQSCDLHPMPGS